MILAAAAYPRLARAVRRRRRCRERCARRSGPLLWLAALAGTGTYLFAGTASA